MLRLSNGYSGNGEDNKQNQFFHVIPFPELRRVRRKRFNIRTTKSPVRFPAVVSFSLFFKKLLEGKEETSVESGSDIARESANIILLDSALLKFVE